MHTHSEIRESAYSPEQLFALVADIESYPVFLPWCAGARIRKRTKEGVVADLVIRFAGFSEMFTSNVTLNEAEKRIEVTLVDGPFKTLTNHWFFESKAEGGTLIHFSIAFAFRSRILEKMIGMLFETALKKMVAAFEQRAKELYGVV